MTRMMRARRVLGIAALTGILLAGCSVAPEADKNEARSAEAPVDLDEMRAKCVQAALQDVPVEEQIRSLLMLHVAGLDRQALSDVLVATRAGGLLAMADNIGATPVDTAQVVSGLTTPLGGGDLPVLLAVDQEGGFVSRIPQDMFPAGTALHGQSAEVVRQAFASRATLVRDSGLNTNFGIVADVTDDPNSFIFPRVLGVTPDAAGAGVAAAVTGERGLVLSTLKHFPGHGATELDSHTSIPAVSIDLETWRSREAVPFSAGIEAGAELVMMGHLVYSAVDSLPASQSERWVDILRNDLGFDGIIITDDMRMLEDSGVTEYADVTVNSVRALQSGASMLLFVGPAQPNEIVPFVDALVAGIVAAVERGDLSATDIAAATARIYEARRNLVDPDPRSWCALVAGEYSITKTP